jgi:NAD(P)-dependent dehydrogenase (short-subunit alcohol dehydrogenase family)
MARILITGANRGIGLAFVRRLVERGDMVFAGARTPGADLVKLAESYPSHLKILPLNVIDEKSIEACVEKVQAEIEGLDLLINNAGIFSRGETMQNLSTQTILTTLHTNAIAPLIIAKYSLDLLAKGANPKIINITSQMGSLQNKRSGGNYSYCGSKATLNMFSRALAFDLQPIGILVTMIHPGWVRTDMGGASASLSVSQSVSGMLKLIDQLSLSDTGKFFAWDGRELPW